MSVPVSCQRFSGLAAMAGDVARLVEDERSERQECGQSQPADPPGLSHRSILWRSAVIRQRSRAINVSFRAVNVPRYSAFLALATLLVAGCGGGGGPAFTEAGPPAPKDCIRRFNSSPAARPLGEHAYGGGHNSRAAHVFKITEKTQGLDQTCAVIFNAADSDREYGILGAMEFPGLGWDYTTQFEATPSKRAAIQALGASQANVALLPDGTLGPLK
jgi:hypothetical protein